MARYSYSNNMSLHIQSYKVPVNWYESSSLNQLTCLLTVFIITKIIPKCFAIILDGVIRYGLLTSVL